MRFLATPLLALVVAAGVGAQQPDTIRAADLRVQSIAVGSDSATLKRTIGSPATRLGQYWLYSGLRIDLEHGGVKQVWLVDSTHATARGLRVGDSISVAKRLYGVPCGEVGLVYCRSNIVRNAQTARHLTNDQTRGMIVLEGEGRVVSIILGTIFEDSLFGTALARRDLDITAVGTFPTAGGVLEMDFAQPFRKRNPYTDCFDRLIEQPYSFQQFCVQIIQPQAMRQALLRSDSSMLAPHCVDCIFYENIRTDTIAIGPRRVVRQRARMTGSIQHYHRHDIWRLYVTLSPSVVAVFDVEDDDNGRGEAALLAVARSIRLRTRPA